MRASFEQHSESFAWCLSVCVLAITVGGCGTNIPGANTVADDGAQQTNPTTDPSIGDGSRPHDGTWRGGKWRGGKWLDGTWCGGLWCGGTWHDGEWRGGEWLADDPQPSRA